MNGKGKCRILKQIRAQIAAENDIAFVTSECKHQGDCSGTCPKCESEVRYLEQELRKRQSLGKKVAVAGIAATLMVSTAGCEFPFLSSTTAGDPMPDPSYTQEQQVPGGITEESFADGEICFPEDTDPTVEELMGVPPLETTEPPVAVMGDIVLPEE